MWHGRAECLSRQPCMQLYADSGSIVLELTGWNLQNLRERWWVWNKFGALLLTWVSFTSLCCLQKYSNPVHPWEQHLWYVPFRNFAGYSTEWGPVFGCCRGGDETCGWIIISVGVLRRVIFYCLNMRLDWWCFFETSVAKYLSIQLFTPEGFRFSNIAERTLNLWTPVYTKLGEILDSLVTNHVSKIILPKILVYGDESCTLWNESLG
jgi:hypothetical protein